MPVTCHLCGRDFGQHSIGIHTPQCGERWEREQAAVPPRARRAAPAPPPHHALALAGGLAGQQLTRYNEAAARLWNCAVLQPCSHCGR